MDAFNGFIAEYDCDFSYQGIFSFATYYIASKYVLLCCNERKQIRRMFASYIYIVSSKPADALIAKVTIILYETYVASYIVMVI